MCMDFGVRFFVGDFGNFGCFAFIDLCYFSFNIAGTLG